MRTPFLLSRHLVYPIQEKAFHRPTFPYLAQLEKSQWLSREGVEKLQLEKLRALLAVAREHCPWHRQRMEVAGLSPDKLGSLADLRRLPTMDKAMAAKSRKTVFDMIAADRLPFIGYHMPFPATGFIETAGDGFRYVPTAYQLMLG